MASSSRAGEGVHKVTNGIPEDLVLSWTRDEATFANRFGTFLENDRQLLQELIQCVHEGKDANATKEKLSLLFGTGQDRKSVVTRARVLSRLIAIALGLHPDDITIDSETGKESLRSSVNFQTAPSAGALHDDNGVLSYLFKDALEADDEFMTVIFCDRRSFKMYPVPYFHGCKLAVVEEISKLWLSQEFLRGFYYYRVLEPLFNHLERRKLRENPTKRSEENLSKATMILCEFLRGRTVKAGARLLVVILSFQNDTKYRVLQFVSQFVTPLLGVKKGKFRKCFFGGFGNRDREGRWHSQGSDQELGRHGQSITVGPLSAQTDLNLLCWAARRGYSNLIRCISQGYTEACQMSPNENLLEDAAEVSTVQLLWKVALWCATRHGQDLVVQELARPAWVKSINFNDYTRIQGCLPPLHLVSLLGDARLLHILRISEVGIESGAYKTDYLGKTPLDHAMQFQLTTRNSKEEMRFRVFTTNVIKDKMQFEAANIEFKEWTQPCPTKRCTTRPPVYEGNYGETYDDYEFRPRRRYSPRPPLYEGHYGETYNYHQTQGHQSCIQELLQMPNVAVRLFELNETYTTQANFVLVGAALIASVAFAGWLQPPLGYADYFQFTSPSPPAPIDTYEQYVAVEGHLSVQVFVVFNALSFFLSIGTMLIGAEATLFLHDNDERTIALMKVRKSIKWMLGFFIASMVCIMAAFICAGLAILPPIQRLEWSMIVSLCLGACVCSIPLTWILSSLARDQVLKLKDESVKLVKLVMQFDEVKKVDDFVEDLGGPLVNAKDRKTLEEERERRCEQLVPESSSSEEREWRHSEPLDSEPRSSDVESDEDKRILIRNMRLPSFNPRPESFDDESFHPLNVEDLSRPVSLEKHEHPDAPPPVLAKPAPPVVVKSASPVQINPAPQYM